MLLAVVVVPMALGLVAWASRSLTFQVGALLLGAAAHLGLTGAILATGARTGLHPALSVDGLGLFFLAILSVLFGACAAYSAQYLRDGTHDAQVAPYRFAPLMLLFLAAMTLACVTRDLGVLWVAVEATTLASAPLVYFYKRRSSLEAAWKYLMLCSVGITLALLGTLLLGLAQAAHGSEAASVALDALLRRAGAMDAGYLRLAYVMAVVGYGTKMGLAPLHTWLPDAHSQAPSPVSALLSGAVLNCALLGILRFHQVAVAGGQAAFARQVLLVLGLLSIGLAAGMMVGQRDYKRLLAYSSVENMGVVAVGVGFGGLGVVGALLHCVFHSLCKGALFLTAGNVLRAYGTTRAADVRGAVRVLPVSGPLLAALLVAIGGAPPFALFFSELTILRSALAAGHPVLAVAFVAGLSAAFLAMAAVVLPMGKGEASSAGGPRAESTLAWAPPAALLAAVLALGLFTPQPLRDLIAQAAATIGGS